MATALVLPGPDNACSATANKLALLISIHHQYAEAILAGSKTVEIRRRRPRLAAGTECWIYVPRPVAFVVGSFTVGSITSFSAEDFGTLRRAAADPDIADIRRYLSGLSHGWAIETVSPSRLRHPVALTARPPQMYRYLRPLTDAHDRVLLSKLEAATSTTGAELSAAASS